MSAMALYDETNPDWEPSESALPGWEPWEPDEADDMHEGGCDYCCDACFVLIVGGVDGDPPWRCGNAR